MPVLSLKTLINVLKKDDLLKEIINGENWTYNLTEEKNFSSLTYDSNSTSKDSLFFCKGLNFKEDYLFSAKENGLEWYVAETPYKAGVNGIIVTDIKKAMALVAKVFYDFPNEKLTLVAITGTKGKTTTSYFTHNILNLAFLNKVGMASTETTSLDGNKTIKSHLSTPESLDLFEMLYTAVNNGLTHFVMEVSSQAYKLKRVYGLTFDYGIFLNISPDHLSPMEHPTFDDYFYCKRQLLRNCHHLVLNTDTDYFPLILQTAEAFCDSIITFGTKNADVTFTPHHLGKDFTIETTLPTLEKANGKYAIGFPGDFNLSNATAAVTVATLLGADEKSIKEGLLKTSVPGRMMVYQKKNGGFIYVDYAHNYTSLEHMVDYIKEAHPGFRIGLLIGAPGDRAYSRRGDFGKIITKYMDYAFLTAEDPTMGDPAEISAEIHSYIQKDLPVFEIVDRTQAVEKAFEYTSSTDVTIVAGKGTERTQRTTKGTEDFEGDDAIIERCLAHE